MKISLMTVVLLTNILWHCGSPAQQSIPEPNNRVQPENANRQGAKDEECDFSSYKPIREDHFVQRAVVQKVTPTYPQEAVQNGIQGWVFVKILVDRNGNVQKACAGSLEEPLNRAAHTSALQWKFKRGFGLQNAGRSLYREAIIAFHFVLDKSYKNSVISKNTVVVQP
jgi:hypothetical protein